MRNPASHTCIQSEGSTIDDFEFIDQDNDLAELNFGVNLGSDRTNLNGPAPEYYHGVIWRPLNEVSYDSSYVQEIDGNPFPEDFVNRRPIVDGYLSASSLGQINEPDSEQRDER